MATQIGTPDGRVIRLIGADLRNGANGLSAVAENFGYVLTPAGGVVRGRRALRPGQFLVFINNKRTSLVAMDYTGKIVRSVPLQRKVTATDISGYLQSLGINLETSTRASVTVATTANAPAVAHTPVVATPAVTVPAAQVAPGTTKVAYTVEDILRVVQDSRRSSSTPTRKRTKVTEPAPAAVA